MLLSHVMRAAFGHGDGQPEKFSGKGCWGMKRTGHWRCPSCPIAVSQQGVETGWTKSKSPVSKSLVRVEGTSEVDG